MTTEMLSLRVVQLRDAYLQAKPFVSAHRAVSVTRVYKDNPGMNNSLLRALAFQRACETAPLHVAQNELIVSHPAGGARGEKFRQKSAGAGWRKSWRPFPRGRRIPIRLMRKQSVCFAKRYSPTGRGAPLMKWRKRGS